MKSQISPLVKFPSPLKHLTWSDLIQVTLTMYNRLNSESAVHSVLDLSSLLCKNVLNNIESIPIEVCETPTSNATVLISNLKPEQLNDNTYRVGDSNMVKVSVVDTSGCELIKDDLADSVIEAPNDDLTTGLEKRRSSRVRTCFDLSDGLNRYCSRRSVATELEKNSEKYKPPSEKLFNSQKENNYMIDRFKLTDRFQTLLPQIFRDLAVFDQKQQMSGKVQSTTETFVPYNSSSNEITQNRSESVTSNSSNIWSQKSVHEFLLLLNSMKPNIITFGISLLLQISQLSGCRWPSELVTAYLNLFAVLQPSFPYILTIASSSPLISDIQQHTIWPDTHLLPEDVLALRVAPKLSHLSVLYITYIELYLEELESTNHDLTDSKKKNFRPTEIPTRLFSILYGVLSGFEESSLDYHIAMSHLLWINYLMSSLRRDYAEMRECVLTLKEHIIEHKLVVVRAYSVHHGDLTVDYMDQLLTKLNDVSSFDRLIQLSNEGKHADVITELIKTFYLQRNLNSKQTLPNSYDHSHSIIKQLDLCYYSLKHLFTNLTQRNNYKTFHRNSSPCENSSNINEDDGSSNVYTSSCFLDAHSLYCYCTVIIEECLILLNRINQHEQIITDVSIHSIGSMIIKVVKMLYKCWIIMGGEYVYEINEFDLSQQSTVKQNASTDISLYASSPLKLFTPHNDDVAACDKGDDCSINYHDTSAHAVDANKATSWLTISEACRTVTVLIDLLICIIRTSVNLLSNWKMDFYLRFISLIYEHLCCIEQSIPPSALPIELRIYLLGTESTDDIPFELQLNAYCGSVSASPSIACLHLFHEFSLVLFTYNNHHQASNVNIPCRDSPELLKLLIQIVIRSGRALQSLSVKFYSPGLHAYLETKNRYDLSTDDRVLSVNCPATECPTIQLETNEYITPVSPDDNTVACTDDLQSTTYKSWPIDCVCLTQVLSCAVKCLLSGCLTREIATNNYQSMDKYLLLDLLESHDFVTLFDCIKPKSVDNYVNFIPEWINTLKNLFTCYDIFDHHFQQTQQQQNSLNKSNWWSSVTSGNQQESLDWECAKIIFLISYPSPFPEYDSIKTLSISNEMLKFLCDTSKIISPNEYKKILPKSDIDMIIQSKVKDIQQLPSVPKGLSFLTKSMYYLIADHYMKNNHFDRAVEYYLQDLRVSPRRVDTWASLGLIYSSELEEVLNLTNLRTERVSAEAVSRCLRCFNVALHLQPDTVTLLIERGCLAYQLHSYGARIVKKSEYRNFPDVHLNLCRKWRYRMLQLARSSYESVLNLCKHQQTTNTTTTTTATTNGTVNYSSNKNDSTVTLENNLSDNNNNSRVYTNKSNQGKEEEEAWLCHYMLAKCAEKDAQLNMMKQSDDLHSASSFPSSKTSSCIMHVLHLYHEALKALDVAGARYPKKIIVYNKIPFRAVEAIEVYYRIHALSLKTLLKYGQPSSQLCSQLNYSVYPINLIELDQFLAMIDSSNFVTSARKPCRRTRKRTANMAGLSTKQIHLPKSTNQFGSCENEGKQTSGDYTVKMSNVANSTEPVTDKLIQPLDITLNLQTITSQEEFIDLTSPNPHVVVDEEELEPSASSSLAVEYSDKLGLWKKCIDRCRCALELVLQRLPLHYKAMYRLASLYLHTSHLKDPSKALDILLGPTEECQKHSTSIIPSTNCSSDNASTTNTSTHSNIGGLFKDRKQNNFFYGVWRIPTADIDRSGNFAAHMYRSVSLTLTLLHDHGDWRRLVQIFHQLRKQPPEEKRGFLGEGDRVYLARRAFNLIQPTLLNWLTQLSLSLANKISEQISKDHSFAFNSDISSVIGSQGFLTSEILTQIYRLHCVSFSRNSSSNSSHSSLNNLNSSFCSPITGATTNNNTNVTTNTTSSSSTAAPPDVDTISAAETSGYASVLQLAYRLCPSVWDARGPLAPLDWILQRCSKLAALKSQTGVSDSSNSMNK
ncbi:Calcineurin-binding protein isoform 2 [Schistosoma japonicum]|uniref:Calcineurin-binding protein isoform 2 n=1 Tax=Schistosoma japonicum TaxID=6182 RepID=A0A4Z2DT89_SCHJA|nr:Calcineurin-binding protein isoform 2 [Schistosoma japonicum]